MNQQPMPATHPMSFEFIMKLIARYDNRRTSISNRAAIVLSANTFLIAGSLFVLDQVTSRSMSLGGSVSALLVLTVSVALLLLIVSTLVAALCIGNVWRSSRQKLARDKDQKSFEQLPNREVFHPTDLVDVAKSFEMFDSRCTNYTTEVLQTAALAELWTVITAIHRRYQQLRWAIRLLAFGVAFYLPGLVAFLVAVAQNVGQ